jgi:hypothetical protein
MSYFHPNGPPHPTSPSSSTPCCPFRSWLSPFLEIGADEQIMVHGVVSDDQETVPGRCLAVGDTFTHNGRLYRVVRRSADYGAVAKEVRYAPVDW